MYEEKFLKSFKEGNLQYQKDHINDIDFDFYFEHYYSLPEEFLEKYQNEIGWDLISSQFLSEKFIEKHENKVNWSRISFYQRLSEGFIERHEDKVWWHDIALIQKLSWEFISKFSSRLDISVLLQNYNLSQDIKNRLKKLQVFK